MQSMSLSDHQLFIDLKIGGTQVEQSDNLFRANQASMTIRGIENQKKTISSEGNGSVKFETQKGRVIENKENTTAMNRLIDTGLIKSKGDFVESIPLFLDETYADLYDQSKTYDNDEDQETIPKPGAKKDKGKAGSKLYKMQWLKDKLEYQTALKKKMRKQGGQQQQQQPDPKEKDKKKPSIEDKKDKAQLENQIAELQNDMMFQGLEIKDMREEIERLKEQNA